LFADRVPLDAALALGEEGWACVPYKCLFYLL
jgi:hypothetical protein